jgi:hypothetical protein
LPDSCPQGFDLVLGICAEICPTGYTAAIGACWQNCPGGWTDMGLFCANWPKWQFSQDDGQVAQARLTFEPSITVQVQTKLFDTALHNLSGVDMGIMGVSIYELIPFRIYGTIGATMSVPT